MTKPQNTNLSPDQYLARGVMQDCHNQQSTPSQNMANTSRNVKFNVYWHWKKDGRAQPKHMLEGFVQSMCSLKIFLKATWKWMVVCEL